jgi:hypothetical protein
MPPGPRCKDAIPRRAGGGGDEDLGLSAHGRRILRERRTGMIACCPSHTGYASVTPMTIWGNFRRLPAARRLARRAISAVQEDSLRRDARQPI